MGADVIPPDNLQPVWARIRAAADVAAVLREVAAETCKAFGAERITVYAASLDGDTLVSILQVGFERFNAIRLPVDDRTVAGYTAVHRRVVNLRDAYDAKELAAYQPPVTFLQEVDRRSGYRTRQLLVGPVQDSASGRLFGVVEVLNRLDGQPFPRQCEEAMTGLCEALAVPLGSRMRQEEEARRIEQHREEEALNRERLAIEALRRETEHGLSRDAPEALARARERLLQHYRGRFGYLSGGSFDPNALKDRKPWHLADTEALDWICRLDTAGHVGAQRLLDRILVDGGSIAVAAADTEEMRVLGRRHHRIAWFLARWECARDNPDPRALGDWLERSGVLWSAFAAAVRLLYPASSTIPAPELEVLRRCFGKEDRPRSHAPRYLDAWQGNLLADIACCRMIALPGDEWHPILTLLERATELGSTESGLPLWIVRYHLTPDKRAYLHEWLAAHPHPEDSAPRQCLIIGAAIERGEIGEPAGASAALPWYVRALGLEGVRANEPRDYGPRTCMHIGRGLADDALAAVWYERGIDAGSDVCFDAWLGACAEGRLGLTPNAAIALDRAQRFLASGVDYQKCKWVMGTALRAVHARANLLLSGSDATLKIEEAVKWLELGALLDHDECRFQLGRLYADGRGVGRDPAAALALFGKAAAQGHAGAKAALGLTPVVPQPTGAGATSSAPALQCELPRPIDLPSQTIETKLDLADAYLDMGDRIAAREILQEVLREGNSAQQARARARLGEIGG